MNDDGMKHPRPVCHECGTTYAEVRFVEAGHGDTPHGYGEHQLWLCRCAVHGWRLDILVRGDNRQVRRYLERRLHDLAAAEGFDLTGRREELPPLS